MDSLRDKTLEMSAMLMTFEIEIETEIGDWLV